MEKDRFIEIATNGKKLDGDIKRLDEISPLTHVAKNLNKTTNKIQIPKEKSESELYNGFIKEKNDLKNHYKPFLKTYCDIFKDEKIVLSDFEYRKETEEDKKDFSNVLFGKGCWEKVKIPHYVGPDGKWNAFYKTEININKVKNKRYILCFESVDYVAEIYLNSRMVLKHTGFFAPFNADITEYLHSGTNQILVVVKNDNTTTAVNIEGMDCYGDKIYGATHLGYDEPQLGWHHCPSGAGITGKVELVISNEQRITDIFVRTNIDMGEITVFTTVNNYLNKPCELNAYYTVEGRNFEGKVISEYQGKTDTFQPDTNYLTEKFKIENYKLWSLETPYLYEITVVLKDKDGNVTDKKQTHFGMRKFYMDENSTPLKGAFYFNNERIMLRGTNEMGHLPKCVINGDDEQLIDDILTAKVAGLNFYRMTQRPVFDKIYTYFDMLGMLCQSDFPLFSYLKLSCLGEALKQVDEMERLTRNHPSVIIETFCNETLDKTAWGKEQYVMSRMEMEKFFNASKEIVEISNPDRVLKYCEGDYAPLEKTHGISDFHCYTFWYVSHGMPSGKLRKGYLPPIRKGWMTGCGEFGVDGLDRVELLRKYCPKEWLPKTDDEPWSPKSIAKAQCFALHGDFFPEQDNLKEWVKASREWQKKAIKDYVDILRFRSDYIESTAVHLLIDAWPCGWTKTLVDVDRIPKPAFYAFKKANEKLRVYLKREQYTVYNTDTPKIEVYSFNDKPNDEFVKGTVSVTLNGNNDDNYEFSGISKGVSTTYLGQINIKIPKDYVGKLEVAVEMIDNIDNKTYDFVEFEVKSLNFKASKTPLILSKKLEDIKNVCNGSVDENVVFTDVDNYLNNKINLEEKIKNGAKVFVYLDKVINVFGEDIVFRVHTLEEEVRANNLVFRNKESVYTNEFNEEDFKNFYNKEKDFQDLTAWFKFYWENSKEILYTFEDLPYEEYRLHKKHKMIVAEKNYGKGKLILSTVSALNGCLGNNPVLDKFFINIIEK